VLDDELNVLPISKGKDIVPSDSADKGRANTEETDLKKFKASSESKSFLGELVKLTRTIDQVYDLSYAFTANSDRF
jgi:N-acetyltransferase 10